MNPTQKQQIIVSGVGGQGVLFVTRLLAEASIARGLPVLTSETHGMAQRGGTVVSHLKVGGFSSPLIRPQQANGLLALKAENIAQFGGYLRPGAWIVANRAAAGAPAEARSATFCVDADGLSQQIDQPRSGNLIVLGFALAILPQISADPDGGFCTFADIKALLDVKLKNNPARLAASLQALEAGYRYRPPAGHEPGSQTV